MPRSAVATADETAHDGKEAHRVEAISLSLLNERGDTNNLFAREEIVQVSIKVKMNIANMPVECGLHVICDPRLGVPGRMHVLTGTSSPFTETGVAKLVGDFPKNFLLPGGYCIDRGAVIFASTPFFRQSKFVSEKID